MTAAGIALGVGGCGHGAPARPATPPSAVSLYSDFTTSFARAQSVRITGRIRDHGQTTTVDLSLFWSGAMKGTLEEGRLKFEVVRADGRTYAYLDKALFNYEIRLHNIPAAVCAVACGRFIRVPDVTYSVFALKRLSRQLIKLERQIMKRVHKSGHKLPVPRVRLTRFDGQLAWELSVGGNAVFIAHNSASYLIGMVKPKFGVLRFSEWNAVPPIRAPQADQVIRLG